MAAAVNKKKILTVDEIVAQLESLSVEGSHGHSNVVLRKDEMMPAEDEEDMIERCQHLDEETKIILFSMSSSELAKIREIISSGSYVKKEQRKYLVVLMKHLEKGQFRWIEFLLNQNTTVYPHIHKKYRKVLLRVLDKWAGVLEMSLPNNKYFLQNKFLTPEFLAFLNKRHLSYPVMAVMDSAEFIIRGNITPESFNREIAGFDPNYEKNFKDLKMRYSKEERLDENFKFGDPFSWHFCQNVATALPLTLHQYALYPQSNGRGTGTAGALIRILGMERALRSTHC
jgi:hypothetical protein